MMSIKVEEKLEYLFILKNLIVENLKSKVIQITIEKKLV